LHDANVMAAGTQGLQSCCWSTPFVLLWWHYIVVQLSKWWCAVSKRHVKPMYIRLWPAMLERRSVSESMHDDACRPQEKYNCQHCQQHCALHNEKHQQHQCINFCCLLEYRSVDVW